MTKRLLWLTALLAASCAVPALVSAQNVRQLPRATATTGVNDSALVLVSDSASRTRAVSTHELFKRPPGTAAKPSYSFATDSGTGIYSAASGQMGLVTDGALRLRLSGAPNEPHLDAFGNFYLRAAGAGGYKVAIGGTDATGTQGSPLIASYSQILGFNSLGASAPVYSILGDTNTGIYGFGADTLGFATGGVGRWMVNGSALQPIGSTPLLVKFGNCATLAIGFVGETNTGICGGGSEIRFVTSGTARGGFGIGGDGFRLESGTLRVDGGAIAGGAGNMTLLAGTGASRTLTLQSTNAAGVVCNTLVLDVPTIKIGNACVGFDSVAFMSGATAIVGGGGNMRITAGTGASRTLTLQTTTAASVPKNTLVLGADSSATFLGKVTVADTLYGLGKVKLSALTAAAGTPNSVCINATTKEITENAATSCVVSSIRYKRNVAPLALATARRIVEGVKPVTFVYKDGARHAIGAIAEQADSIDSRLVSLDARGRPNSINYEQITAALLKVVQDQQRRIDSLVAALQGRAVVRRGRP